MINSWLLFYIMSSIEHQSHCKNRMISKDTLRRNSQLKIFSNNKREGHTIKSNKNSFCSIGARNISSKVIVYLKSIGSKIIFMIKEELFESKFHKSVTKISEN